MSDDIYTCTMCGGVFEKAWSDEEAVAEAKRYFGEIPEEKRAIICDSCFNKIHPEKFPLATKIAKTAIAKAQPSRQSVAPIKSGTNR